MSRDGDLTAGYCGSMRVLTTAQAEEEGDPCQSHHRVANPFRLSEYDGYAE